MEDLSLNEIASRIADAVIEKSYVSKRDLQERIRPLLKIWLKKADSFKRQKASKSKLQETIESRDIQQKFWLKKYKELIGSENMQPHYDELTEILKAGGYIK